MSQEYDDLQYVLQHYWQRYRKRIIAIVVILLVLWASGSTFYKVEADSEGVVLRLGKLAKTTPPGLHFKLPWPIDVAYTVPVNKVQSEEFGYRTLKPGVRTQYARGTEADKTMARMLTADLNLAHVEWVVLYQIKDSEDFLFKIGGERRSSPVRNAQELIRNVSEAVMRRIIGDVSADSVITIGREKIGSDAKVEMQQMLDSFEAGIKVVAVKLQTAAPPDPVKDAFDAVNRAKQSKERVVNEAKGERNRLVPAARGARDRAIAEAEGYAVRIEKDARGRANAFLSKLAEYEKAPEVTRMRLYIEAMEGVLAQVSEKIIIDRSVQGMLPLLNLDAGTTMAPSAGLSKQGQKGGGR
ncbi:MAG: FtsH protease activity modulator HflK [Phycisphaerales bacterium]|nr:MAG: FtsH protease activity modulator HflK [Phycisphaerales bacterium]